MGKFGQVMQSLILLIVRLVFGAGLMVRGLTRVMDGYQHYEPLLFTIGLPWPSIFYWGAVGLEIGGGALIALGLLTRIVAACLTAEFTMTILWIHWWNGFHIANNGYEYAAVLVLLSLLLVAFGAGAVSIDRLLFGRTKDPTDSVVAPV
ncbi:MAG: DoxX family protein [Propionibacteriaceae bacterium]|jgi:putative oxidoreductase|nr:DoxX family protein [Propionibacteriaceae bacterium]